MRHVVQLNLDTDSAALIRGFWKEIGLDKKMPPHVTLAIYDDSNETIKDKVIDTAKVFAEKTGPLDIVLASFGVFPKGNDSVFFMAPVITKQLIDIHQCLHDIWNQNNLMSSIWYQPDKWVPHSTLDMPLDATGVVQIMDRAMTYFKDHMPLQAQLDTIDVVEIGETIEFVFSQKLKAPPKPPGRRQGIYQPPRG